MINTKLTVALSSFFLVLFISTTQASGVEFQEVKNASDWNNFVRLAQSKSLNILIDAYADWCGYCKMMDRDVFSDEEVGDYLNANFVNVKIDGESAFGEDLLAQYEVSGYPTYLFLDAHGTSYLGEVVGYVEKEEFLSQAQKILAALSYEGAYNSGNISRIETMQYAAILYSSDEVKAREVAAGLDQTMSREEILNPDLLEFMISFTTVIDDLVYQFIKDNQEDFANAHGREGMDAVIGNVFNHAMMEAIHAEDVSALQSIEQDILPLYVNEPEELPRSIFVTRKMYHANILDWSAYKVAIDTYQTKYGENLQEFWYTEAYEIVNEYSDHAGALEVSFECLDKALAEVEDFETYFLYAYAYGLNGDYEAAGIKALKAKEMVRDSDQEEVVAELIQQLNALDE